MSVYVCQSHINYQSNYHKEMILKIMLRVVLCLVINLSRYMGEATYILKELMFLISKNYFETFEKNFKDPIK